MCRQEWERLVVVDWAQMQQVTRWACVHAHVAHAPRVAPVAPAAPANPLGEAEAGLVYVVGRWWRARHAWWWASPCGTPPVRPHHSRSLSSKLLVPSASLGLALGLVLGLAWVLALGLASDLAFRARARGVMAVLTQAAAAGVWVEDVRLSRHARRLEAGVEVVAAVVQVEASQRGLCGSQRHMPPQQGQAKRQP